MKYFLKMGLWVVAFSLTFVACTKPKPANLKNGKLQVVTTMFPLYDFVKEVGQDKVDVVLLLPPGAESHSFEPTPQDIITINESSLFFYTDPSMEVWAEEILASLENKNLTVLKASQGIKLLEHEHADHKDEHHDEHADHKDEHHDDHADHKDEHHDDHADHHDAHHHHGKDPHIWLDLAIDQKIVSSLAKTLGKLDSANKDFYYSNAKAYNEKLATLDKQYQDMIPSCEIKTILYGGHFAFGYFAKRYGLEHVSPYPGFTPNSEPGAQKIAQMIDTIKEHNIKHLYYEKMIEPKVAKTIADATGVQLLLLRSAHNVTKQELEDKVTFYSIMQKDLEQLKIGLRCK